MIVLSTSAALQWVHNNTEIERMARFCIAYEFHQLEAAVTAAADSAAAANQAVEELRERCETLTAGVKARDSEAAELAAEKERHLSAEYKALEARVAQLARELVKETSGAQHLADAAAAEDKALTALGAQELECAQSIAQAEQGVQKLAAEAQRCEGAHAALLEEIASLQAQQIGISMNDGAADGGKQKAGSGGGKGSLSAQLMEAQRLVTAAEADAKQVRASDASVLFLFLSVCFTCLES